MMPVDFDVAGSLCSSPQSQLKNKYTKSAININKEEVNLVHFLVHFSV